MAWWKKKAQWQRPDEASPARGQQHGGGADLDAPLSVPEKLRFNAELVRKTAEELGHPVGFERAGVVWLDGFIERQSRRTDADRPEPRQVSDKLGACLGEAVIASLGGEWALDAEFGWGVRVDDNIWAFPMNKAEKHLSHGSDDSVLAFFDSFTTIVREQQQTGGS